MSAESHHQQRDQKRDSCACCPYGYHIDLDFVQYAAEEARGHDSLKLMKKQPKTKTSKSMEPEKTNRKSTYENVPTAAGVKQLQNQFLFSDSLENVMSDFEETLSRGGARRRKDYSSDYEMSTGGGPTKKTPTFNVQKDGYASDYGYAVPAAARPNNLRFITKPAANHYYVSPNTVNANNGGSSRRYPAVTTTSGSSSPLSVRNANGSAAAPVSPGSSNSYESSRILNTSRPSFDASLSRLTPTSDLLSPRLVTSSPVPPKPSLGLSGRVGAQIEQLASHLTSDRGNGREFNDEPKMDASATRRILELEHRLKAIPGPAFGGEKRRLQDELNRLVNEGKKTGYYRSITPTVLDTGGGGGYATALARAMSSVAAAQRLLPEPPPRRESVARMQTGSTSAPPRTRTYSANEPSNGNGSLNLDAFHSYRRINPLSTSSSSSNATASTVVRSTRGREDCDYVSDSEYALGDRSVDRFAALRRSRHLLSRPQSALPPAVVADDQSIREIDERNRNGCQDGKSIVVEMNGDDRNIRAKPKPMTRTIGVVTDSVVPTLKTNASTCTPPLPQPKPCTECDGLRQRILELSVKPLTFTRGAGTGDCSCDHCHRRSLLSFASVGCGTSSRDSAEYLRDAATTAEIEIPCEECEKRHSIEMVSFGVNTELRGAGVETGANTDFVQVHNRHVNTDRKTFQVGSVNTTRVETTDAESIVDKAVLGGYRAIACNTTPPMMVTFGVNTDHVLIDGQLSPASDHSDSSNISDVRLVSTTDQGTTMDDSYLEGPKTKKVDTKSVAVGTSVFPSTARMVDKYVDSTVRTRDVGTRTPPPPPPPLQPLRSSGSQTINEAKTMISVGSGDCTLSWNECDSCQTRVVSKQLTTETQTEKSRIDRQPSSETAAINRQSDYRSDQTRIQEKSTPENVTPDSVQELSANVDLARREKSEPKRGIQRIFSPKLETRPDLDPAMWNSQLSADNEDSSDRVVDQNEDSTVVCPLDDDEEEEDLEEESKQEPARKFDFTKPRQTRAFALSKAAAAKKLLTSDGHGQQQKQSPSARQSSSSFQRNYVQSKSMRVDSKKGDSLAFITEKKQFHGQGSSGAVVSKLAKAQTPPSTGLKGKVVIKKNPPVRKATPAPTCPRSIPTRFARSRPLPYQHRRSSLPVAEAASSSMTSSTAKDDDVAAEAEDVVGPLPSEVAAAAAKARWSGEAACYTNMAVENGDRKDERDLRSGRKKLVGRVVENLPTKVERNGDKSDDEASSSSESSSGRGEEETDESLDEGSYDTNGNISSTCDVGAGDSTISEDSRSGDNTTAANSKFEMSQQLSEACTILNAYLVAGKTLPAEEQVEWAQKFLQHEWLKTSASKRANPAHVGDFLDALEDFSLQLLRYAVNFCDQNENTALHYAVSRGHFDIVSLLLDTKLCNLNKPNKAGYTPVMLASLCPISSDTDSMVIQRLFQMGDVNIKASQHGQTALMLAVSHGNLDTTKLLLEAGAGVNIQDEEGSTALMCAAEHGHKEIVRLLLAHPETDASMTDNDNSTALSIAVENDHKDIGILIYAHLNYERPTPSFQSQSAPVWC